MAEVKHTPVDPPVDLSEIAADEETTQAVELAPPDPVDEDLEERSYIRLECLKCAVTGSAASFDAATILQRAKQYENFVLTGEAPKRVGQFAGVVE